MPLTLNTFDVYLARDGIDLDKAIETGDYTTHRVTILHADQLVAEQAGPRYGMPKMTDQPIGYTTLWCWAALQRAGVEVPEFPLFKGRVLAVEKVKVDEPVDPTNPGPGTGSP